jgi:GT2 family glycosyltransferase
MNLKEIFLVVVLYKTSLEDSKTINSLENIIGEKVNLFVFDNSPIRQYESDNFYFRSFKVRYHHDGTNPGLSIAYNYALDLASNTNYSWLLLLDQDTTFTIQYIQEIKRLDFNNISNSVVAIIPRVVSLVGKSIIAPAKMLLGGICRPIKLSSGVVNIPISGINSGTLLSIFYMNSINGFSEKYTLDMLDHWYFRKIFNDGKSVYVLDSFINQELSIFGNFEENVSFIRYQQMLKSESLFIKEEGILSLLIFKFRLIFRVLKQIKYKNSDYYKFTLKQVFILNN